MSWTTTTGFPALPITRSQPSGREGVSAKTEELADTPDEDLLAFVQAGNCDALGVLFRRFAHPVRNVGQRILRDKAEADDLVQEVFLYIHRKSTLFDDSKGSARSWIIQVSYTQDRKS